MVTVFLLLTASIWTIPAQGSVFKKACLPDDPIYNVSFVNRLTASTGFVADLGKGDSIRDCINKACSKERPGNLVYLLGTVCHLIKCDKKDSCKLQPQQYPDPQRDFVVAYVRWVEVMLPNISTTAKPPPIRDHCFTETTNPSPTAVVPAEPKRGPDGKIPMSKEHELIQDLIYTEYYNPKVRPVLQNHDVLTVNFSLKLVQIVDVDEKAESLKANVWATQIWKDPFLTWNASNYDGIDSINVEPTLVWLPVIILYNNAATGFTGGPEKYKTKVIISSDGTVTWFASTQFISSCKLDITYFPFDDQYCELVFGSWTYSVDHMIMTTKQTAADLSSYILNGEWDLVGVPVVAKAKMYPCCPMPYSEITYTVHIRRKVLYYIFNLIVPSTIVVMFTMFSFCLPPISGERIVLNITVLLSMTVFLNIASNTLPTTSDSTPLLANYYMLVMVEVMLAILCTCVVLRYYYCGEVPQRMPKTVRSIINEWIGSFLCYFITTKKMSARSKINGFMRNCKPMNESCHFNENYGGYSGGHDMANASRYQAYMMPHVNNNVAERLTLLHQRPSPEPSQNINAKAKSEPSLNHSAAGVSPSRTHSRRSPGTVRKPTTQELLQGRIIEGLNVLTRNVESENERSEIIEEWQYAAEVLDQLFCIIFFITMFIPLLVFFLSSPKPPPRQV